MIDRLIAWWARIRLPRCDSCGALVAQRGDLCSDACVRDIAERQGTGF